MKRLLGLSLLLCSPMFGLTAFLSGVSGGGTRSDYTGTIGYEFTMASTQTAQQLGRECLSGNSQMHTVYLMLSSGISLGTIVASVTVSMSGCTPGTYVYASITPYTLLISTSYYILSTETNGGDAFHNSTATYTTTAVGTIPFTYYADTPPEQAPTPINQGSASMVWGTPNFTYGASGSQGQGGFTPGP